MQTLTVQLGDRSYPIYIGNHLLNQKKILSQHVPGQQVMIVSNETVVPLYLETIKAAFNDYQCDQFILPDGEQYKTIQHWEALLTNLLTYKHHRATTLIALGGGVVGDMTGFAAACYQRGVHFIQIPTSLLAQVDASIGGKTAVNHPLGKNMIGAFHQPRCVIIDIDTLATLPDRELSAGLAEMIKAALICDADFLAWIDQHIHALLNRDNHALNIAIHRACAIKVDIVAADEREQGKRALLNLGHTFGHAIEHCLEYKQWLHGEAVAMGLLIAANLSVKLKWLQPEALDFIKGLLQRAKLPIRLPNELQCAKLQDAMLVDKKIQDKKLRLVLLKGLGKAVISSEIDTGLVRSAIMDYASTLNLCG